MLELATSVIAGVLGHSTVVFVSAKIENSTGPVSRVRFLDKVDTINDLVRVDRGRHSPFLETVLHLTCVIVRGTWLLVWFWHTLDNLRLAEHFACGSELLVLGNRRGQLSMTELPGQVLLDLDRRLDVLLRTTLAQDSAAS